MKKIVMYISGHGFGHATRMQALVEELETHFVGVNLFIRTNAPAFFFEDAAHPNRRFHSIEIDTGTYQRDCIHVDTLKTLQEYAKLIELRNHFLPHEHAFMDAVRPDLIIGDIPPAAFYIAHEAGIPSVAIGNFSWDWIFEPYIQHYPHYAYIIDDIQRGYRYADRLFRLPFYGKFAAFDDIVDVPLLVRKPKMSIDRLRHKLGIESESRPIVLCSFGGFKAEGLELEYIIPTLPDFFFIGFGTRELRLENGIILSHFSEFDHPSLVMLADMAISKLGFGTVAECITYHTPLLYISREDFKEYPVLQEGLHKNNDAYLISKDDFFAGHWQPYLQQCITGRGASSHTPRIASDGAERIAALIEEMIGL